ncbi:hypothetical protein [Aquamicrobium sp.]|uniref:hypothetical protein n=1 Tax=Aquamicrobium sp. TaxID=1872579 RepID=UPI002587B772|nr:hypothetical protein [Aquamicrobium sp.]MCK9549271.1 hypothetical protein [Aquamicrobium sp.]
MFNVLDIRLTKAIPINTQKHDSIITIESIRDFILKVCDNEPEMIRSIINKKEHSLPHIIYSKPYKNQIRIFSLGDNGRVALNAIYANVVSKGYIKIKNESYKIQGVPKILTDIQTLPTKNGAIHTYTTLTPINIFNKYNHKVFLAIANKHFEGGKNISGGSPAQKKAFYDEISVYVNTQIKDNIRYLLSSLIPGKTKEDFVFVDDIKIEWEKIDIIFEKYHTEEKSMPMIIGKFRSNFALPKFLGYKMGKGFGEISLKSMYNEGVA